MTAIKITRSNEWANKLRGISIYLDDKPVGKISNGETKEFEISPGNHALMAKMDWCSTPPLVFTIAQNDSIKFTLTSFAKHNPFGVFAAFWYTFFKTKEYLVLEKVG